MRRSVSARGSRVKVTTALIAEVFDFLCIAVPACRDFNFIFRLPPFFVCHDVPSQPLQ
jgi:hypothetical protein